MAKHEFDVVVVGGGPGGYVAAIRSAQLGMKTALVEREHLGGICLNWGCIPTKALLRTAEIYALMDYLSDFGLKANDVGYDFPKVIKRSRQVASQLSRGVQHLLRKNKVQVFDGHGRLDGKKTVAVEKDGTVWVASIARNELSHYDGDRPEVVELGTTSGGLVYAFGRTWTSPGAAAE